MAGNSAGGAELRCWGLAGVGGEAHGIIHPVDFSLLENGMKEQGPAPSLQRGLSSAHTAPIKQCPDQAFLHIRNPALFNEDQLNTAPFYLAPHNRRDTEFPFFFPGN